MATFCRSQTGPTVADKATTISYVEYEQLSTFALLPALCSLVNIAYKEHEKAYNPGGVRLKALESLSSELGPGAFTIVLTFDEEPTIPIASCSARPLLQTAKAAPASGPVSPFARVPLPSESDSDANETIWEIKFLVTHPKNKGQGLASCTLDLIQDEIRKRAGLGRIRLVLSTLKELNLSFYQKRGFEQTGEVVVPSGVGDAAGTGNGTFTVAYMDKVI